jgi:hypothetical protein
VKLYLADCLNFGPSVGFSTMTALQFTRVSGPKINYCNWTPTLFPEFVSSNFWLLPNIKPPLKGHRFHDTEDIQKQSDNGTEKYSTTGIPKTFPTVAASLGYVHSCSRWVLRKWPLSVSCKYTGIRELHSHTWYIIDSFRRNVNMQSRDSSVGTATRLRAERLGF